MRHALASLVGALALCGCDGPPMLGEPRDLSTVEPDAGAPPPGDGSAGAGYLRIVALDDLNGLPIPARAIITAVAPTPAITFDLSKGQTGMSVAPGVIGAPEGVVLVAGDGAVRVPAGTYDVFVTHGPEWEAHSERVTLDGAVNVTVTGSLRHSVDTTGWLGADLHIHADRSYDAHGMRNADRVVTEVAVGVEVLVTTDHNVLTDLQPEVDLLGYGRMARAIVGDEFNYREGHGGAYPMPYDGTMEWGGTVEYGLNWEAVKDVTAGDVFDKMHAYPTRPAVTINHPRLPPDLGYFINLKQYGPGGWAPPSALPTAGKFDGLELMNGYMDAPAQLAVLMRDWFFLLSSGYRVTALGSSDTHRLSGVKAGFPRSWLRLPTEDPAKVNGSDIADAVKAGRAIASNGPFAVITVGGAQIGDLVSSASGSVMVDATVDAPDWIDVDQVRIYVNGQRAQEYAVAPGQRPRFHRVWSQPVPPGDGWIVLSASGTKPLPSGVLGTPGMPYAPFAITNPVFLDGDNDGAWTPLIANPDPGPGLPLPPPAAPFGFDDLPPREVPVDCEPPLWVDPSTWPTP